MALDPALLKAWPFPRVEQTYCDDDAMRYALSVGLGADPMDLRQLPFVVQDGAGVLPTMATVLASPGPWTSDPRTGVTRTKLVHGEQVVVMHRILPRSGTLTSQARVVSVVDRGAERGAVIYVERDLRLAGTGELLATLRSASFCRADGGFGGSDVPAWTLPPAPGRNCDRSIEFKTALSAALLYQLNGDRNPLHTSPAFAAKAGFERPILHGLCTFGIAGQLLMGALDDYRPDGLREISARFSAPVLPGDTLRVDTWQIGSQVWFRVWSVERNVKVLDNGYARFQ